MRHLITRRYSQVEGLRRRGILSPAAGPCEIDGCQRVPADWRGRGTGFVYEHCHRHDYIRGVTCGYCNGRMIAVDAHVDTCAARPVYLAWWLRCPGCAAGPPWEPWVTDAEHDAAPMLAELLDLGRHTPGSPAARQSVAVILAVADRLDTGRRLAAWRADRAAAASAPPGPVRGPQTLKPSNVQTRKLNHVNPQTLKRLNSPRCYPARSPALFSAPFSREIHPLASYGALTLN